jgi:YD repeat-containing protein
MIDVVYDTAGCGCSGGDRPAKIIFDRGETVMQYDSSSGNLSQITAPGGESISYTYDGSLPTQVDYAGTVNGNVRVVYNNDFKIQTQWVNNSYPASYYYDDDGNLEHYYALYVNRNAQNGLPTGICPVQSGSCPAQTETRFYDINDTVKYNAYGEVNAYHAVQGNSSLFQTAYEMDDLGRITGLKETMLGDTVHYNYSYDLAGRLKEVYKDSVLDAVYEYDANGNRLASITPTDTVYGVYDAQDRLLSYGGKSFGYTANGSLRYQVDGVDTTWYTYDLLGNLTEVFLPNGDHIEYVIDGNNRRIAKKLNGAIVKKWLYQDQLNPVGA